MTADVQKRLGGAGERGFGQILGGRRRADRQFRFAAKTPGKAIGGSEDVALQIGRQRGLKHGVSCGLAGTLEDAEIFAIEAGEKLGQSAAQVVDFEQSPVGIRGGGEAIQHADATGRKGTMEFAKRGVLAPHLGDVCHADLTEVASEHVLRSILQRGPIAPR